MLKIVLAQWMNTAFIIYFINSISESLNEDYINQVRVDGGSELRRCVACACVVVIVIAVVVVVIAGRHGQFLFFLFFCRLLLVAHHTARRV